MLRHLIGTANELISLGYDETEETCRAKCLGVNDDALNKCSPDANTTWYKQCGAAIYGTGKTYDETADTCAYQCREILDETSNKCQPSGSDVALA